MNSSNFMGTSNIGSFGALTKCVKFLLIINIIIFIGEIIFSLPFLYWFGLPAIWWKTLSFSKLFTYMFVHGSFNHLLANMIGLFFIGPIIERTIGSNRFFVLYYLSGILGGLGWSILAIEGTWCIGASGAVMGILGAFAAFYPNLKLLLWFILPVKAWLLVLGLIIWELSESIGNPAIGGIANTAHLIGLITGIIYAIFLKYRQEIEQFIYDIKLNNKTESSDTINDDEINEILDKIGKKGIGSLSEKERKKLDSATRT